jgi:hypothetical protein
MVTGAQLDALFPDDSSTAPKRRRSGHANGELHDDVADDDDDDDDDDAAKKKQKKAKKARRQSGPRLATHVVRSMSSTAARDARVLTERQDGSRRVHLSCLVCRSPHPPSTSVPTAAGDQCVDADTADAAAAVAAPPTVWKCDVCSVKVHAACVPEWHRNDNRDYRKPHRANLDMWFACPDCVRCLCCGSRDSDLTDDGSWRCMFRFCEACWTLQGALTYCPICRLFYRNDEENMVQCELCDFWIHSHCDDISALKYDAMAHRDELYVCRLCRGRPDYMKRLARTIKLKLAAAALPDDDVAAVQASIDAVDSALFLPFQHVCDLASDDESSGPEIGGSGAGAGSSGGGRRKNSVLERSAAIAAAILQSDDSDGDDDDDDDASLSSPPPPDAVATDARLEAPTACDIARDFERAVADTTSYTEFTRRRTHHFVETTLLDAHLCCFCGASAPDVRCAGCGEAYHWFCISPTTARAVKATSVGTSLLDTAPGEWRCMNCKLCTACGSGAYGDSLVVCDYCDRATHLLCFDPPLAQPPQGDDLWACPPCRGRLSAPPRPTPPPADESSSEDMPVALYAAKSAPLDEHARRASATVERMVDAAFALALSLAPAVPVRPGRRALSGLAAAAHVPVAKAAAIESAGAVASSVPASAERDADGDGDGGDGAGDGDDGNDDGDGDDDDDDDDDDELVVAQPIGPEHEQACVMCRVSVRFDADAGSDPLLPLLGRALPLHCGPRVAWIHARCALWVPEAALLVDGRVLNLDSAISRASRLKCAHCGKAGASVGCVHGNCPRSFHLPCALVSHCSFDNKERGLRCVLHRRDRANVKPLLDDVQSPSAFKSLLRVGVTSLTAVDLDVLLLTTVSEANSDTDHLYESVDDELDAAVFNDATARCRAAERALKSMGKAVLPCASAFWRFGELVVARFGSLAGTPAPLLPPHTSALLTPIGYTAFRHFWSVRDARKPALFCFRVLAAPAGAPGVRVGDLNADWVMRVAPVRFAIDELSDAVVHSLLRCTTALSHADFQRLLESTSENALFGATHVHDVDAADEQPLEPGERDAKAGTRVVGSSLDAVWACVAARTSTLSQCGAHTYRASDLFGLSALPVVNVLERLPAAERCIYYRSRTRYFPHRLQLPSEPFRPPRPVLVDTSASVEVDEVASLLANQSARTVGMPLVLAVRRSKGLQFSRGLRQGIDRDAPPPPPPPVFDGDKAASEAPIGSIAGIVPSISAQYRRMKEKLHRIRVGPSKIAGWGAFLTEPVGANEMLIEYVGEWIRLKLADVREIEYERNGMGCYMFRVNDDWVVDATMKGGHARFLNHSCDGNAYTRIENVDGAVPRILIYSKRAIEAGAELTYDYNYALEPDNPVACHCGAAMCRGRMN